jgi:hypothetical protein
VAIQTCPTDVVAAPGERIWKLLTQPTELAAWAGAGLIGGPTHTLVAGDRFRRDCLSEEVQKKCQENGHKGLGCAGMSDPPPMAGPTCNFQIELVAT